MAGNSASVLERIRERTGVAIEVISGEEESRLAYLAVVAGLGAGAGSAAVFDTGGGSSQFTFGRAGGVEERFSVNVGAARYTEQFGLDKQVSRETLDAARHQIRIDLSRLEVGAATRGAKPAHLFQGRGHARRPLSPRSPRTK